MLLWRICPSHYAHTAFTGEGSRLFEARWHRVDSRVVYTATSLALASVEFFVNLDPHVEPTELVSLQAMLPDEVATDRVELASLPEDWRSPRASACQEIGSEWLASRRTAALIVPSAAVMHEWNVLLNPEHPDFKHLVLGAAQPFRFDRRMFRRA